MMFGIGEAIPHHSPLDWFWDKRYSGVKCHYAFSLQISSLVSYVSIMVTTVTGMFKSLAIPFEPHIQAFWNEVFLFLQ